MRIAFDIESTGKNPLFDEIIEAFFLNIDTQEFHIYKAKTNKWSYEAEKIHGITRDQNLLMPDREISNCKLVDWLPSIVTGKLLSIYV